MRVTGKQPNKGKKPCHAKSTANATTARQPPQPAVGGKHSHAVDADSNKNHKSKRTPEHLQVFGCSCDMIKEQIRSREQRKETMAQENTITRYVAKDNIKTLIDRLYKRGFDDYAITPSKMHPEKMIIQILFDGDVNSSRAETQVDVMFGTIPNE